MANLLQFAENVADTAYRGCHAETFHALTTLLQQVADLIPTLGQDFALKLNPIMRELLCAQERCDLVAIADLTRFELRDLLKFYLVHA